MSFVFQWAGVIWEAYIIIGLTCVQGQARISRGKLINMHIEFSFEQNYQLLLYQKKKKQRYQTLKREHLHVRSRWELESIEATVIYL